MTTNLKRILSTPRSSSRDKMIVRGQVCRFLLAVTAGVLAVAICPSPSSAGTLSTDVIGMFPQNVGEVAYADLREARAMPWFPQLQEQMLPARFRQFEKFLTTAGVDPNSLVEEVAWALVPEGENGKAPSSEDVVGVALGNFRPDTTEAFFRSQKIPATKVHDLSLYAMAGGTGPTDLTFCFLDNNTAAFGQRRQLERLIAVRYGEAPSLLNNAELSPLITSANGNGVVWMVLDADYTRLAMQQLLPQAAQFPQAQTIVSTLRAMTIEISTGSGIQAHFQAVCASPDTANTFAALLQAGMMYQRYQVGNSNPDLAALFDGASIAPSGDRLDVRLSLTNDQVLGLIRRNTFAMGL